MWIKKHDNLLRHGADDDTRLGGWSDAGLSALGVEQVKQAGKTIADGNYNICRICSSDLPRAKETAEIIAGQLGVPVVFAKEFRETNNGDLAGIKIKTAKKFSCFHRKCMV
ncbi:MAG: histidine phosphatase family protein [Clostridia bacterium]|nr:histidine phosphatase family protein [Clostridia bacterium]